MPNGQYHGHLFGQGRCIVGEGSSYYGRVRDGKEVGEVVHIRVLTAGPRSESGYDSSTKSNVTYLSSGELAGIRRVATLVERGDKGKLSTWIRNRVPAWLVRLNLRQTWLIDLTAGKAVSVGVPSPPTDAVLTLVLLYVRSPRIRRRIRKRALRIRRPHDRQAFL